LGSGCRRITPVLQHSITPRLLDSRELIVFSVVC
jgi:hypothetical protein